MSKTNFTTSPIHPRHDWRNIMVSFVFFLLVVVGWSVYLFIFSSQDINADVASQSQAIPTHALSSFDKVNAFFDGRAQARASSTLDHFVDPSI